MNQETLTLNRLLRHSDLLIALGVLGTLIVMILPIPAFLMDLLLVLSFTMSIAILLTAVYSGRPLDFSVFPTILLFSTLFRLSLNVASVRLVLLHGHEGTAAAGRVIETFGNVVVGGSYIVGIVVFILLVVINFVVITKGAGRVAEVAARFILDAMPGKQLGIDADLNAGLITEDEARARRRKIEQEGDFYGAMDGASKFVRGDAIAGVLITLINIVGGLTIGVFQKGLSVGRAAELYTLMTVGDGLVTQIPSLVVSTAAGIVVTRAASGDSFSRELTRQLFFQPRVFVITAAILGLMGIFPGIPAVPFLLMAAVTGGIGLLVARGKRIDESLGRGDERRASDAEDTAWTPPDVEALELSVGYGLLALVEEGGSLVDRITSLRKELAKDLGLVVPKVTIRDDLELDPTQYAVLIRGAGVGKGELLSGHVLAMDPGTVKNPVPGIPAKEPVFGLAALWVQEKHREWAESVGYTVVDSATIITTHLAEVVRRHAHELVGRQELQGLVEHLMKSHPKVVEDLIPGILPLGTVLKVCQNLLREGVSIRDLALIFETLANHGTHQKDPEGLTELVRAALARTITSRLTRGAPEMEVMTMDSRTEEMLLRACQKTEGGGFNLEPGAFERLVLGLQKALERTVFSTGSPVLLCHPSVRGPLKRLVERFIPNLNIVSANEIASFARVRSVATVTA